MTAGVALGVAGSCLSRFFGFTAEEAARWVPLRCPLNFFAGIRCPTCGLGRALVAAAGGDWPLAWSLHPLAIPLLIAAVLAVTGLWLRPRLTAAIAGKGLAFSRRHRLLVILAMTAYSVWGFFR